MSRVRFFILQNRLRRDSLSNLPLSYQRQRPKHFRVWAGRLVLRGRFELPTPGSSDQCSNQLSYLSKRETYESLLAYGFRVQLRQALLT